MTADGIVGERIHQIMWRERISQARVAETLGLTQSSVSKRLRGATPWTLDELLAIARILNVSPADLLPGDDYSPVPKGRGRVGTAWAPRGSNPQLADYWTTSEPLRAAA